MIDNQSPEQTWNILVIDDDEDDYYLVHEMLKAARGRRVKIQWASTYAAGREALLSNHYHAVLVDYNLGAYTGIDLIREATQRGCPAPLILYSGMASYEIDVEAMQAGAALSLIKGETSTLMLESAIRHAIGLKTKENELRKAWETAERELVERRKAQLALRENQERLHDFLENTHDSFFVLDQDWRIQFVNRRFAEVLGKDAQELTGQLFWEAFSGYLGTPIEQHYRKVMAERTPVHFELGGIYSPAWYEVSVYPTRDGICVFAIDRTARKQAQEDLEAAYARLRIFLDANILGVVMGRLDGTLVEVNDYFLNMLGYSRAEFEAGLVNWRKITPSEHLSADQRAIAELQQRGTSTPYEKEYVRTDGSRVWVYINQALLPDGMIAAFVLNISERKQAEQTLQHNERRLAAALDIAQLGVWEYDVAKQVTYFDRRCQEIFGLASEGPMSTAEILALIHPADCRRVAEQIRQALDPSGTGQYESEYRILRPDGTQRWVSVHGHAIRAGVDTRGEMLLFVGTLMDITGAKRAEEAIRKSEAHLRASQDRLKRAQQIAHLGSWELDVVHNQLTWSDEVYRIFGLQPQEFTATYEAFLDCVHPDDRAAVDAAYSGSLCTDQDSYEIEHRVVRKSTGEIRIVHEKCEHFRDAAGQLILSTGMVHDITERKQAEQALRAALDQATWLARFPDENPNPVARISADGRILYRNLAAFETPGMLSDQGQRIASDIYAFIRHAMETGQESSAEHELGGQFYSLSIMPFPFEGYANLYARDVTEGKQAQAALADMVKKLESSNQELEQFAFVASHDLQEPLRKIKMFGEVVLKKLEGKIEGETQENLERMVDASKRMQAMIDDLLALSRVNIQGRPFVQVDLSRVAAEVVSDLEPRIQRSRGKVVIDPLPAIEADPIQIQQMFQNLIGNALKFHQPGTPPVVKVSCTLSSSNESKGEIVSILVQDNGIGFEEQEFEKILQPFVRISGRSQYEGTGIGLAIVNKIVQRHGGTIRAHSKPGQGSTFILTFPVKGTGLNRL